MLSVNVKARKFISDAQRVCVMCDPSAHKVYILPTNDDCSYVVVRKVSNCFVCVHGLVTEYNIKMGIPYEAIPYKDGFCFTYEENNIE